MDGRTDEDPGLLERARQFDHRESLPPEEFAALMKIGPQLVQPSIDTSCFIIGSYDSDEKTRLMHVRQTINDWPRGNHRAYLMEDFPDGLHPLVEFQLLADYADHVIGIFEHERGGFQFELGMLIGDEYQDDYSLLKRRYPTEQEEHAQYNWMLNRGAFDLLEYYGAIREWRDTDEFEAEVNDLLTELLD